MQKENEYEVKAKEEKSKQIEELVDKKAVEGPAPKEITQPQKRVFSVPQISKERIFKTLTDREVMRETLHDETLEPHVHLAILLLIVFILAIIISLLGI